MLDKDINAILLITFLFFFCYSFNLQFLSFVEFSLSFSYVVFYLSGKSQPDVFYKVCSYKKGCKRRIMSKEVKQMIG